MDAPAEYLVITAAAGVGDGVVAAVRAALGAAAGTPNRLGGCAVEIPLARAADRPTQGLPVGPFDLNFVPAEARRKRLLIADMDSTIIPVECIDELADFAGVKEQVATITDRAMRGELEFEGALLERVALLKGLPLSALAECYAERISLNPGAKTLVAQMNAAGAFTALVSGGFTYFVERVAKEAGFVHTQANELLLAGDHLSGDVARPILGREAKARALADLATAHGLEARDVVAIGDGANDADMIRAAGLGVAYKAKPALVAVADARLDHSDLSAVLALQGIAI